MFNFSVILLLLRAISIASPGHNFVSFAPRHKSLNPTESAQKDLLFENISAPQSFLFTSENLVQAGDENQNTFFLALEGVSAGVLFQCSVIFQLNSP